MPEADDIYTPDRRWQDALYYVMSSRLGRAFMWRLLQECHVFETTFVPGHADSTAYNEGMRRIGLLLLDEIEANVPDAYLLMTKEAKEDQEYDRNHHQSRNDDHDD